MFGVSLGIRVGNASISGGGVDADAQAYFDRVTAAGGTLTTTEKTAVNQLVIDMKANGTWTPMKAIYPMVGSSAAACAQNLKSSSFTGTFSSGWTFASNGATPNGTSAFMDSNLVPNTSLPVNNFSLGYYSNLNIASTSSNTGEIGVFQSSSQMVGVSLNRSLNSNNFIADGYGQNIVIAGTTNSDFFGIESRISTTSLKLWKNNVLAGTNTTTDLGIRPTVSITIGKSNGLTGFSNRRCAFAYISDGLTDTQVGNFYTSVQIFNQTLNRQVGAQIVSDADAQAYINRVYTAGGTLTNTEANAVNQLTIDMKSANVWSAMKAIYPMVGSSAAACAQNLKSSSFTGTFTSGWTFASTGATPNGTSAYMNTGLNPNLVLSQNSKHISSYVRTNIQNTLIGVTNGTIHDQLVMVSSTLYANLSSTFFGSNVTPNTGFYLTRRITSTTSNTFRNSTLIYSDNLTSNGNINANLFIGARNATPIDLYSNSECAFASIGDGLTDTQASNFYTSVQTFQTTLSRNV
jgi:hypothetical protein